MHRPNPLKLHPLHHIPFVPILAHQFLQPLRVQPVAEPGPQFGGAHEEADVYVCAFVAGAGEGDGAEGEGGRGAEGGEREGGRGRVGGAGFERGVGWWVAGGDGGGWGGGGGEEHGEGFGEEGLRVEGGVVG